jgi:hypothetical protein
MTIGKTIAASIDTPALTIQAAVNAIAGAIQAHGPSRMAVGGSALGTAIQATIDTIALPV